MTVSKPRSLLHCCPVNVAAHFLGSSYSTFRHRETQLWSNLVHGKVLFKVAPSLHLSRSRLGCAGVLSSRGLCSLWMSLKGAEGSLDSPLSCPYTEPCDTKFRFCVFFSRKEGRLSRGRVHTASKHICHTFPPIQIPPNANSAALDFETFALSGRSYTLKRKKK